MRSRYAVRRLVLMICVNVPREKTERVSNSQASSQEVVRYAPFRSAPARQRDCMRRFGAALERGIAARQLSAERALQQHVDSIALAGGAGGIRRCAVQDVQP